MHTAHPSLHTAHSTDRTKREPICQRSAFDASSSPPISSPTEFALTFNTEENRVYTINRYNYQYCATARCKVQFGALDRWQHVSYAWKGYELVVDGVQGVYNDFLLYNNGDPVRARSSRSPPRHTRVLTPSSTLRSPPPQLLGLVREA